MALFLVGPLTTAVWCVHNGPGVGGLYRSAPCRPFNYSSVVRHLGPGAWASRGLHSTPQRPLEYGSALHVVRPLEAQGGRILEAHNCSCMGRPPGSLTAYFGDP